MPPLKFHEPFCVLTEQKGQKRGEKNPTLYFLKMEKKSVGFFPS